MLHADPSLSAAPTRRPLRAKALDVYKDLPQSWLSVRALSEDPSEFNHVIEYEQDHQDQVSAQSH
jgi:hypothetical protein